MQAESDHAQNAGYFRHAVEMINAATKPECSGTGSACWTRMNGSDMGNAINAVYPLDDPSVLLPPRIVARRAQSHAALASNCLMLAVRVAKRAAVIAAGCRLPTDDSVAPPSPRLASCTFGCGGAALGYRGGNRRRMRGIPSNGSAVLAHATARRTLSLPALPGRRVCSSERTPRRAAAPSASAALRGACALVSQAYRPARVGPRRLRAAVGKKLRSVNGRLSAARSTTTAATTDRNCARPSAISMAHWRGKP